MIAYHDTEWGVPLHDDQKWFEFMVLDTMQAGLSWQIILRKREGMREAFAGFNPNKVASFTLADIERLLQDPGIIRNRQKVIASVGNAQRFIEIQNEFGSFTAYVWQFVSGQPQINGYELDSDIPAKTELSDRVSKDLLSRGFKFVGSTICYAFMQAGGLVNDHVTSCFRYNELVVGGLSGNK